jgi:hypothetical protein
LLTNFSKLETPGLSARAFRLSDKRLRFRAVQFRGEYQMNENELKLICLQTDVENAIGMIGYYRRHNYRQHEYEWDQNLTDIIDQILQLNQHIEKEIECKN